MRVQQVLDAVLAVSASLKGSPTTEERQRVVADACCAGLSAALPGKVLFPGRAPFTFTEANDHRWSTTAILSPRCIVQPDDTADVSAAMQVLTSDVWSYPPACPFAIKSGGHTPFAGANNIDDGVVIDLSHINSTIVSADRKIVSIGPGSTWQAAANTLNGTGIGIPTGRCPSTGVGGVTLGGGISFSAPRVGFAADNVLNYEIVLANGTVLNCNYTSHPSLYKALKGGGSNFGIVTRFDFAAFAQPSLWSGGVPLPADEQGTHMVLKAMHDFTRYHSWLTSFAFGSMFSFNKTRVAAPAGSWNNIVYSGNLLTSLPLPAFPITVQGQTHKVRITDILSKMDLADILAESADPFPWGYRNYLATVAFANDLPTLKRAHDITVDIYDGVKDRVKGEMEWLFAYEPLPTLFSKHSRAKGGNVLGLDREKRDLILMQLAPRWTDAADDAIMQATAREWVEKVGEYAKSVGKGSGFVYYNYADGFQDPIASYGEENVVFMREVAREYDPRGVFQRALRGGFKIPGMDGVEGEDRVEGTTEKDEL